MFKFWRPNAVPHGSSEFRSRVLSFNSSSPIIARSKWHIKETEDSSEGTAGKLTNGDGRCQRIVTIRRAACGGGQELRRIAGSIEVGWRSFRVSQNLTGARDMKRW